jgi:hypothetical protein
MKRIGISVCALALGWALGGAVVAADKPGAGPRKSGSRETRPAPGKAAVGKPVPLPNPVRLDQYDRKYGRTFKSGDQVVKSYQGKNHQQFTHRWYSQAAKRWLYWCPYARSYFFWWEQGGCYYSLNYLPRLTGATGYYLALEGKAVGPFDRAALTGMVPSGALTRTTLVWQAPMPAWQTAEVVADLQRLFGAVPPTPPTPPLLPPTAPPTPTPTDPPDPDR